ncbi:Hypothetical predicted protein [Paramuricea clavata]|uniref:Uncharacterized protein n=1 Tax=Paramuricea clavata TaxID=317549 RepID=A0A6S7H7L9_PARCT|nr:Hypothetical predicted protein [Paramuricea clavata]
MAGVIALDYIALLIPASSQNKGRTLKTFISRAESALWFSKHFGLDVDSMLVKESDTGKKHTVLEAGTKETQDPTANSEPGKLPGSKVHSLRDVIKDHVVNGKEEYSTLKESFGEIFSEIRS